MSVYITATRSGRAWLQPVRTKRRYRSATIGKPMPTAEVRIAPNEVAMRLDEIRRWLNSRGIKPTRLVSTGSADEAVLLVEFNASSYAEAFASEFSATLVVG